MVVLGLLRTMYALHETRLDGSTNNWVGNGVFLFLQRDTIVTCSNIRPLSHQVQVVSKMKFGWNWMKGLADPAAVRPLSNLFCLTT